MTGRKDPSPVHQVCLCFLFVSALRRGQPLIVLAILDRARECLARWSGLDNMAILVSGIRPRQLCFRQLS